MRDGELEGMQYFDGELEKLLRAGVITRTTAVLYATNAGNLQVLIADIPPDEDPERTGSNRPSPQETRRPAPSDPRRHTGRYNPPSSRSADSSCD